MLQDLRLKEFVEELGSSSPAPGGGSIAALSASLASALASMVFNLTIGKKDYLKYEDTVKNAIDSSLYQVNLYSKKFLNLVEKDTEAFLSLMKAYKMPKNTDMEIELRKNAIKKGNDSSLEIPLQVAESAYRLYPYIFIAVNYGNKNAISDAGVAASLVETAVEGAVLNIKINIQNIEDKDHKVDLKNKCDNLLKKSRDEKEKIMRIIESKLE
ncbi:cyclodeaminase/cyclohydrolase family protein [Clostridium sp. WLY-B-L2]|jgi:formiminotetrahydrofolate cyclodeaminase|uniref:Cyclodeaminase/cyclohydrolase family protein n=1 Tax=Clostridium aromativorans TaxID=2836848 RepID=A0ABS8N7S7_9CLOT|nr:cyclodeaminase/cyclohydrolase family protein [Clostridium aromativorans]MCC9295842.1 cyclodeaminase/cyclohydrolase family protein [Clostridium aromativorans]